MIFIHRFILKIDVSNKGLIYLNRLILTYLLVYCSIIQVERKPVCVSAIFKGETVYRNNAITSTT